MTVSKVKKKAFDILDLTADEREYRRKVMKKIGLYMATFPDLERVDILHLEMKAENRMLDIVIENIEFQLSSKRSFEMPLMAYRLGVMGIEKTSCAVGLKCQGLAQHCTTDDDILDCAKELFIKYDCSKDVPCEYRLAMSIGMVMLSLHTQNSMLASKASEASESSESSESSDESDKKEDMFNDL